MRLFIYALLPVTIMGSAAAQQAPLDKVYACAGITKADERLACYDAAVSGLKKADATGDVAVISRQQVAEAGKQAFGFKEPDAGAVARAAGIATPAVPEQLDNVQVTVSAATKRANGRYHFTLENGQEWEQVEAERVSGLGKFPLQAEIKRAALGSFMMKVDGGRPTRVRRVK